MLLLHHHSRWVGESLVGRPNPLASYHPDVEMLQRSLLHGDYVSPLAGVGMSGDPKEGARLCRA
jgi:hypothetical protein